jgi:hypothetical protein
MLNSKHSAPNQFLGYLFQVRYSLWALLKSDENNLLIENLDDVSFEENGTPLELIQLKHHISKQGILTDNSVDVWKTIGIWSSYISEGIISKPLPLFTLVTTNSAQEDSGISLLRQDNSRDSIQALNKMLIAARSSENTSIKTSILKFLALSPVDQELLFNSIILVDSSPNVLDIETEIKKILRLSARPERINHVFERLDGWWLNKVISYLCKSNTSLIYFNEVQHKIVDIAEQLQPESLPIDFLNFEPPIPTNLENDERIFIKQLLAIAINKKRVENAIRDYYRAFEQRSRWAREELLFSNEIEEYENKLKDEWYRFYLALCDDHHADAADENELQTIGQKIFKWVELDADIHIRPNCREPYVIRGSYHLLADKNPPDVWWHPKFAERLVNMLAGRVADNASLE